jgi:hypothetical protein
MNVRLGVYELFSRIVPGGLYIAAIVQLLMILGVSKVDLQSVNEISLVTSIGLILVAYTVGGAFDIFSLAWFRLFEQRGVHSRMFATFKNSYQDRWEIDFTASDRPLLLAFIRTKSLELADEIDRHNAVSIMLRNVSLGIFFLGGNSLIQFLILRERSYLLVVLVLFSISILIILEAKKFRKWFYDGIFQTILAYRIDLENAIRPVTTTSKRKSAKR